MKRFFLSLSVLSIFSACMTVFAQTAEEKKVLDEINLARTAPQEYVKKVLEPLVDGTLGKYQSAVVECISLLKTMKPRSEISWSTGLFDAARNKPEKYDDSKPDYTGRISKYVSWTHCGEVSVFGYSDARSIVLSLLLDIQSETRSHRRAIFSDRFTHMGASIRKNETYGYDCILDFAAGCISYRDLPNQLYHEDDILQLILEINLARTRPLEYISTRLEPLLNGNGEFQSNVSSLISYLKNFEPVPELTYSKELCQSAKKFVDKARVYDFQALAQSALWERNIRATRNWGTVVQAFSVGETDPRAAVIRMLVEPDSRNRDNLLSPKVNFAGASMGENTAVCVDMASWHDDENTPPYGLLAPGAFSNVISEINWARSNPREYSKVRLEPLVKSEKNAFQTALSELIKEMSGIKVLPTLKMMDELNDAASEWLSSDGTESSTKYDPNWLARISRYGMLDGGSEVLYFGDETAEMAVVNMLIDSGNPGRNRRMELLSPKYHYVGAATSVHGVYGGMALVELGADFVPNGQSVLESKPSHYGNSITMAEVDVLNEINLARSNPTAYVNKRLAPLVSYEKNEFQTALNELISELNSMKPISELAFNEKLHDSADELVASAAENGLTASDSGWADRIERHVDWKKACELVSVGRNTAESIVIQLLVDEGVTGRGHRRKLLNGNLTHAGVAIGAHPNASVICVVDLVGM